MYKKYVLKKDTPIQHQSFNIKQHGGKVPLSADKKNVYGVLSNQVLDICAAENDNKNVILTNSESQLISHNDLKCAPGKKFENGSCIPLDMLVEMAEAYNSENKNKIVLDNQEQTNNPAKYKKRLIRDFKTRLSGKCDDQMCWLDQKFVNNLEKGTKTELRKFTLRPEGPEGQFEWLNTININEVMAQYEKKYPDFKFFGAVPIDFDDINVGIAELDFNKLVSKGIHRIGFVFNLDTSKEKGSHWVSAYAHLTKGQIYFFDSYGIKPDHRIKALMDRIEAAILPSCGTVDNRSNRVRHQFMDSECGLYSMNFILRNLNGESFDDICKSKVQDKIINKCRDVYFTLKE